MSIRPAAAAIPGRSGFSVPTTAPRTGGLGHVLVFAALSVGLAAAATYGGVTPALVPFVLAFGPTAFALTFAWREGHGAVRRLLKTAVTRPSRRAWYAIVALPFAWALAVVGVAIALGDPAVGVFDKVFPAIVIVPVIVLLPAFAEEIAWRGYAVNRLLPTMSPLAAALLLGAPWALIHVFLQLPGQMNAGLEVWPTLVSLMAYSIILTGIYVASGGSVLLTALVHAGLNGVAPLMAGLDTERTWIIRAVLAAGIAIAVVVLGRMGDRSSGRPGGIGSSDRRRSEGRPTVRDASKAVRAHVIGGNRSFDLAVGPRR
jgi:membrane protease YdiL (CAAX protease family)